MISTPFLMWIQTFFSIKWTSLIEEMTLPKQNWRIEMRKKIVLVLQIPKDCDVVVQYMYPCSSGLWIMCISGSTLCTALYYE